MAKKSAVDLTAPAATPETAPRQFTEDQVMQTVDAMVLSASPFETVRRLPSGTIERCRLQRTPEEIKAEKLEKARRRAERNEADGSRDAECYVEPEKAPYMPPANGTIRTDR